MPAAQSVQADGVALVAVNLPGAQLTQLDELLAPVAVPKVPAGHAVHATAPDCTCLVPALHGVQPVAPDEAPYLPGAQLVQLAAPAAAA